MSTNPKALITGITGQDGSYLAELLLEKGYRVCGITRRSSTGNMERIAHIQNRIELISGDLTDQNLAPLVPCHDAGRDERSFLIHDDFGLPSPTIMARRCWWCRVPWR